MLFIVITMLVIVAIAGLVVALVALPHGGGNVPGASWLGDTMGRAVSSLPTIADGDLDAVDGDLHFDLEADREPIHRARR